MLSGAWIFGKKTADMGFFGVGIRGAGKNIQF
jgi:hypothetical protein